jgi:ATPase family associated with various cellular activities (AAA)
MESIPATIDELARTLNDTLVVTQMVRGGLDRYVPGPVFVSRPWQANSDRAGSEGNPTAAAFSAYLMIRAGRLDDAFSADALANFRQALGHVYEIIAASREGAAETDTQALPNNYNTPILLAGALAALNCGFSRREGIVPEAKPQLDFLISQIERTGGYLESLSSGDYSEPSGNLQHTGSAPSAYHTFWAAAALDEARRFRAFACCNQALERCLALIGRWAERAVSEMLAWHVAPVPSRFDVIDTICATSLVYQFSTHRDAQSLADRAVFTVFESYFMDGQLTKSRAILADRKNNRSIICSTYEALAYLYSSVAHTNIASSHIGAQWKAIAITATKIGGAWDVNYGISNDQDARYGTPSAPTAFSTSAAMATAYFTAGMVEDLLDREAKLELGVSRAISPFKEPPGYPEHLRRIVDRFIKGKVNSSHLGDKERAFFSMIWFGPPGTGKTSFARHLAQELGWSFLQITLKDFLQYGGDFIDASAERIFRLLLHVKDTVILFDELEELIQARDSETSRDPRPASPGHAQPDAGTRRLTTSMLPRIHELRDRERVVFIFATNRMDSLDTAATRLGRFDAIVGLPPPNQQERGQIFEKLAAGHLGRFGEDKLKVVMDALAAENFPRDFLGMIYKDVEFCVKQIASHIENGEDITRENIKRILEDNRSIENKAIADFRGLCEKQARPRFAVKVD